MRPWYLASATRVPDGAFHSSYPPVSLFSGKEYRMFENHESVRQNGTWDPNLDAYRVVDPKDGSTRYYVWKKPALFWEALAALAAFLFWFCVAVFVYSLFFQWPDGVAGDRRAQLAEALGDRYRVNVNYLPQTWSGGQVFTVDVTQDWDDPHYDEPAETTKACRLQPGETADDLSLQCPDTFGGFEEVREGGLDADQHRRNKALLEETIPRVPGPGSDDPSDQYATDPYEQYEPDPYDYYEPEQMFP